MTHTKGPWRVNGRRIESGPIVAGDGGAVATLHRDLSDGNIEANARLIALAPELAAQLKAFVALAKEVRAGGYRFPVLIQDVMDDLDALLAQLEGREEATP